MSRFNNIKESNYKEVKLWSNKKNYLNIDASF